LVPQQFFPSATHPELIVELRLKEGRSCAATTERVEKMEAVLAKEADVKYFDAYTGAGQPRFYLALNPELPNPGYAVFVVMTKDTEARERARARLMTIPNEQFPRAASPARSASSGPIPRRCARSRAKSRRWLPRARRYATCSLTGTTRRACS